jgi:hypothetical protein
VTLWQNDPAESSVFAFSVLLSVVVVQVVVKVSVTLLGCNSIEFQYAERFSTKCHSAEGQK